MSHVTDKHYHISKFNTPSKITTYILEKNITMSQVTDKLYHIMLKRTFISKMDPLVTMSVFTLYFLYL